MLLLYFPLLLFFCLFLVAPCPKHLHMHLHISTHFTVTRHLRVCIIPILQAKKLKLNSTLKGKYLLWQTFNLCLYDFKACALSMVSQGPKAPQPAIRVVTQDMVVPLRAFTGATEPSFLFSSSGHSDLALRISISKETVERCSKLS